MAKKLYIGVSNKARKATKLYVGVNNIARQVKKAYIGVNSYLSFIMHLISVGHISGLLILSKGWPCPPLLFSSHFSQ